MPLQLIYQSKTGTVWSNLGPRAEPYINQKGEAVTLNRWRAYCCECDAPFEILYSARMNPELGYNNSFNRMRCDMHKRNDKPFK